ncbi:hypothetical protein [Desulfitobacterium hafniense]|uniref:hypothetical protein n=1 Tax=Desulfitobacterium hafniense TaxID=49338 RepID=UPI0003800606|nr:hypothetical protein [Desulfitobacterium hafniense]
MNDDVTPEARASEGTIGPPNKCTVPQPQDPNCCVSCPYPSVGFICWSPEGSCLKTEVEKISRRSKGR